MEAVLLLAKANLRKTKSQTAAITILILLAGLMLNLWLMLSMDYKQNFDRYHDLLHEGHVTLSVDGGKNVRDFLTKTIENDKRTAEYSLDSAMQATGLFSYHGGEVNSNLVFLEKQAAVSRPVGKTEILEDSEIPSGIYMPMLYQSEDIQIGKTVTVTIGSHTLTYTICGFFNSVMAGSHNCSICELILTEDKYRELEKMGYAPEAALCSVRLHEKKDSQDYEAMLKNAVSSQFPAARAASNSYTLVSQSRYISQMICSGIMSAMAFFILLITLVVIVSNIANYIQEDMKNLGALKAMGYTSRQLIGSLLFQFVAVSAAAALAGISVSYTIFPFINTMMVSQTGIPYEIHFLPLPMLVTILLLSGTVAGAVWLSGRKIRGIPPIVALRQGFQAHNFKRCRIPLETTKAPLSLALALKTAFSGWKHNLTIGATMLVLSLVVVFSGLMLENVITDITPFLNLVVGEMADSCVNVNAKKEEVFLRRMTEDRRVENIYLYHSQPVSHVGGIELWATICDDFSKVNNQEVVFKGRFPKYGNEIAVAAKYAGEHDLNIGDEITIAAGGKEAVYLISGYTQISNNLGKDCLLTRDGYERFGHLQNTSYYLNLADGTDIEAFNLEAKEWLGDDVYAAINIKSAFYGMGSVYVSLITYIVISILLLSGVIIVFVLYLLVRTMINSKKQTYGIMKALGFTTGQLILQTALSFLPAFLLSTVVGLGASSLIINPLTAVFLRGIGIVSCTFDLPAGFIAASGAGLVLFAFAVVCLLSLKIKTISPRTLITGE